jgi:hypothetical protein
MELGNVALGVLVHCPACGTAMSEPTPEDRWQRCAHCHSEYELELELELELIPPDPRSTRWG